MAPFLPVLMSASNLFSEYIGLIVRIYFSMAILIISEAPYSAQFREKKLNVYFPNAQTFARLKIPVCKHFNITILFILICNWIDCDLFDHSLS